MPSDLPKRVSLVDQVVMVLRDGITSGRWRDKLPGERVLSTELQISRGTLRSGLDQLIREGILKRAKRGCSRRVETFIPQVVTNEGKIIRILIPSSGMNASPLTNVLIGIFSEHVNAAGYRTAIECHPSVFTRHRPGELRRLDSLPDTAGWVLFYSNPSMQQWFASNGKPCVALGGVAENVPLSSVDRDAASIGRHAAGLLFTRGYRKYAYLLAEFTALNDHVAGDAFVKEARRLGACASIVTHNQEMRSVRKAISELLDRSPHPDAFVSYCPRHCGTTLCHCREAGLLIPKDAAIICLAEDLWLEYTVPTIAHYQADDEKAGRKLATVLVDQIKHGPGKIRTIRLMSEFVSGGSVGRKDSKA